MLINIESLVYNFLSNTKDIFYPHIPAVKKGRIVAAQVYHYGFGERFNVYN